MGHFSVSVPRDQSVTLHFEGLGYRAQDITITPKRDCTLDVMMESDCWNDAIELNSFPDSCSICGSKNFVPVLYGLPSKEGLKLAKEGKCVLGRFSTNARDDLKMSYKTDHRIEGFYDYVVPPLEGFWWQDGIDGNPAGKTQKPGRHGRAHSNGILFASDPSIIGIDGADEYRRFEEIGAASISFSCESTEIGHQLPIY